MECDGSALFADNGDLFASSDDEVEVMPMQPTVSSSNETVPKPVSSNNENSTVTRQPYELNVSPLHQPTSSRTPVPEEYQPLPDSSSSFDYTAGHMNPDSSNSTEQRSLPPDINIRYQPKPQYWCHPMPWNNPNHGLYNNYVVLHNLRSSFNPPLYTMASNRVQQPQDGIPHVSPETNQNLSGHSAAESAPSTANSNDNPMPINLERPSRKLNISPRRRQSKEAEVSNLIELSSEEEDNAPRKKQCDNGAGAHHSRTEPRGVEPSNSGTTRPASFIVKGEPHDLSTSSRHAETNTIPSSPVRSVHTNSNAPAPLRSQGIEANTYEQPVPTHVPRLTSYTQQPSYNMLGRPIVKQENEETNASHWVPAQVGHNMGDAHMHRHSPHHVNFGDGGHRHHHHHHHHHHLRPHYHNIPARVPSACPVHNTAGASVATAQPPIKEEPASNSRLIKQESNIDEVQATPLVSVKNERAEIERNSVNLKTEPRTQSPVCKIEAGERVTVKAESSSTGIGHGSGDQRLSSPQPGPSTVIKSSPNTSAENNTNQVINK